MTSKAFEDQFVSSVLTIQRIINNGFEPAEAAAQATLAIEAVARSVPLPSPYTPAVAATVERALAHTRAELAEIAKPDGKVDSRAKFSLAFEHRQRVIVEQDALREQLRTQAQRAYAASAKSEQDVDWVDSLLREEPPGPLWRDRYDMAKIAKIALELAQDYVAGRAPVIRPTTEIMPFERRRRPTGGEKKRLAAAILNYDQTRRLSRLTRPSTADQVTQTAAGFIVGALIGVVGTLGGFKAAQYHTKLRFADSLNIVTEKTILEKCVAQKSLFEFIQYKLEQWTWSESRLREDFANERLMILKCWEDEVNATLGFRQRSQTILNFLDSGVERLSKTDLSGYERALQQNLERMEYYRSKTPNDPFRGVPITVTPFIGLRSKQVKLAEGFAKEIRDLKIDILTMTLAQAANTNLIKRIDAAFFEIVKEERETLFVYSWTHDIVQLADFVEKRIGIEARTEAALPDSDSKMVGRKPDILYASGGRQTLILPAFVTDNSLCLASPIEETNAADLYREALETAREAQDAGTFIESVVTVRLNDTTASPAANQTVRDVQNMTIIGSAGSDFYLSMLGPNVPADTNIALVSPDRAGVSDLGGMSTGNALLADDQGSVKRVSVRVPGLVFDPIFDGNGPRSLRAGLDSAVPPDQLMRYFAYMENYEDKALARFPALYAYIQSIAFVITNRPMYGADKWDDFASYVQAGYEAKTERGGTKMLLDRIEALEGNKETFAPGSDYPRLTSIPARGTELRVDMRTYIFTFLQRAYTVDLTCYWHFGRIISVNEQRAKTINLEASRLGVHSGVPNLLASPLGRLMEQAFQQMCGRVYSPIADNFKAMQTLLGRSPSTPSQKLVSRRVNGAAIAPDLAGKLVYIDFLSTKDFKNDEPPVIDRSFVNKGQSFQRVYAIRDTELAQADTKLADNPFTIVDEYRTEQPPEGTVRDVLLADVGEGEEKVAFLTIYDSLTDQFGPTIAAASVTAARALAGSNAAANQTIAAHVANPTVAGAPLDPNDDSMLRDWFSRLRSQLPIEPATLFTTLTDPLANVSKALLSVQNFFSKDLSAFHTFTVAFESLSHLSAWLEIALKIGGVVVNVARIINSYTGCCDWLAKQFHRLVLNSAVRYVLNLFRSRPRSAVNEDDDPQFDRDVTALERSMNDSTSSSASSDSLPEIRLTKREIEELDVPEDIKAHLRRGEAVQYTQNVTRVENAQAAAFTKCWDLCGLCCGKSGRGIVLMSKFVYQYVMPLIGRLVAAVGAICGFQNVTAADTLQNALNTASFGLLVIASPILLANADAFAQSIAISLAARTSVRLFVEYVSTLLSYATTRAIGTSRSDTQKIWRDVFMTAGLLGVSLAPWLWGSEYTTIARTSSLESPLLTPISTAYDPIYRPTASWATTADVSIADHEIELAVFAGSAVARMFSARFYGLMRSMFAPYLFTSAEAVAATTAAFSREFIELARRNNVRPLISEETKDSPYKVWAEIGRLSIVIVNNRMAPTSDPFANELRVVGEQLIAYIRATAVGDERAGLADMRRKDAAGTLTRLSLAQTIQRSVFNVEYLEYANGAIAAAVNEINTTKLLVEVIAITGREQAASK